MIEKKVMTFDEYDDLVEKLREIRMPTEYYPEKKELDELDKLEGGLLFAIFLHEFGREPRKEEEKEKRKALFKYINSRLELREPEEEAK